MVILCSAAGLLVATPYIMACSHTPCYTCPYPAALPSNLRNGTAMQSHSCQPYLLSMPSVSEWRHNKQYQITKMILQDKFSSKFKDILYAQWNLIFTQKDLFPAGFEPATLCVWSTRDNRYTKETLVLPNPRYGTSIVTILRQTWRPAYFYCPWESISPAPSLVLQNPTCGKFLVGGT